MNFSAVILAGGKSSRMGRDKAFLEIGGQTLLARQIKLARETGAAEILISGRADADYSSLNCRVLQDNFPDAGPLAGIERALDAAQSPLLLVLAVDFPGMNAELLRRFVARCPENFGAIPRINGNMEPLAAIYPTSAHQLAAAQIAGGRFAVKEFAGLCVQSGRVRLIELEAGASRHFVNWNSPADWSSSP